MKFYSRLYFSLLLITFYFSSLGSGYSSFSLQGSDSFNKKRFWLINSTGLVAYSSSLVALNELWYAGYPQSSFHFFNDNEEWNQIDKCGHFFSAYYESVFGIESYKWAGVPGNKPGIYGGLWGFILQTPIEILDGFSKAWGASWGDLAANTMGAGIAISQELLWNEQKFRLKYSFHPTSYSNQRPDLLGSNLLQELIKDYNGITFWISGGIYNFLPTTSKFPKWLDLSVGYGSDGMLGVTPLKTPAEFLPADWERQFYCTFDVNLLKIKTNNKLLKRFMTICSFIKFPAPTFEITSKGKFIFHPVYF